ncbi:GAF and ANTAR domain-containing protein [Nakamurella sp. GG22]
MSTPAEPPERTSATALAEAVRRAAARRSAVDPTTAAIEMATESGPCDAASITLLGRNRSLTTVASSNDLVRAADSLQYELDEGPCLDAVWTDGLFVVPDLIADGRWPRWAPRAAELGVAGIMAVHLFTDSALGALNLYSLQPRTYDHSDVEAARIIAAHASVVLAYSRTEQNLWQAIDSRNLIGQAQGILMERFGLSPDSAFAVLRRYSQHHNRKLAVLAEELVSTGRLPGLGNQDGEAGGQHDLDDLDDAERDEMTGSAG